jgi:cob(I)alamin adenosyltransferase
MVSDEPRRMRIYTRTGDDGTTGLLYGSRVAKDSPVIAANGAVDETQAAIGAARAEADPGSPLDSLLAGLERDLYVLMAEVATPAEHHHKLRPGASLVTDEMVEALERAIDDTAGRFPPVTDFVIPGHDRCSAALDVARTVCRRAEREVVAAGVTGRAPRYLNRLSDLLWALARWQEHGESERAHRRPGKAQT